MEGVPVTYCFVILSEVTMTQKVISAAVCLLVILCALFIVKWWTYRSFRKAVKAFNFFGSNPEEYVGSEESPVAEKKVVTIYDYYEDPFDKHHFISPVDPRLTVREIDHKNRDLMSYTTSWPHLFTNQQLAEIQKMILEITKLVGSSHQLVVTKSSAARFFDFDRRLIGEIFAQLHRRYALQLFPQKADVIPGATFLNRPIVSDKTLAITFSQFFVDDNFIKLTSKAVSYRVSFTSAHPQTIFLYKGGYYAWSDVKQEMSAFLTDYFSAGIKISGEWSLVPKPAIPPEVSLLFKGKCELVLTFSGIHLQERIKDLMKAGFWGVDFVHVHYIFDPRKSVVTLILCPEIDFFQPFVILPPILEKYNEQLNFNIKVVHPEKASEKSKPALINYQINALGQLAFFLPFDFDSNRVKDELLLKVIEITDVDLGYEVHSAQETRVVVSKRDDVTWSGLQFSILSVLVSIAPRTLLTKGEWPEDIIIADNVFGEGSINT